MLRPEIYHGTCYSSVQSFIKFNSFACLAFCFYVLSAVVSVLTTRGSHVRQNSLKIEWRWHILMCNLCAAFYQLKWKASFLWYCWTFCDVNLFATRGSHGEKTVLKPAESSALLCVTFVPSFNEILSLLFEISLYNTLWNINCLRH